VTEARIYSYPSGGLSRCNVMRCVAVVRNCQMLLPWCCNGTGWEKTEQASLGRKGRASPNVHWKD
jgi:hypothetical protein